jgi:2-methylcitrate dehydratase PrpD
MSKLDTRQQTPVTELAEFVADLTYEDIPDRGVDIAKECFLDTVGVAVAGTVDGAGTIVTQTVDALGGETARIIGTDLKGTPTDAAFAIGTLGHALDFDDVTRVFPGHPSVTLIAPILALAETRDVSGEDAIRAYVAGYEAQCYVSRPISEGSYQGGWHGTAMFGTFAAAAATADLLDLDAEQTATAFNIAASMPAGITRNFGTMTKPMHAGQAARSGLTAALLASNGFTATPDSLSGEGGFFEMYRGDGEPDLSALKPLGEHWSISDDDLFIKKFPCCGMTHSSIEAAITMAEEHDIDPESVEHVEAIVAPLALEALKYSDPETGLNAKFSMEYTVARGIVDRRVGLSAFEDENVDDPVVQRVRERTTMTIDDSMPFTSHKATVRIELDDGETYEHVQESPPGSRFNPLSEAELRNKFTMCVDYALDTEQRDQAYEDLRSLESVDDVSSVTDALTPDN